MKRVGGAGHPCSLRGEHAAFAGNRLEDAGRERRPLRAVELWRERLQGRGNVAGQLDARV